MFFLPPQHGKSTIISEYFPAFALGRNPKANIVLASYAADLAQSWNRKVQRVIDNELYSKIFHDTRLSGSQVRTVGSWLRNTDKFEIVGHGGSFKATSVEGPLTGNPMDIGIIDDPIKDALEAQSETTRRRIWEWYLDVFCTRAHNNTRMIFIMTRWHEDDLAGRILNKESDWEVISIPAIREDELNKDDPRQIGDVLWPERHSFVEIMKIKSLSERTYNALYQQRPASAEGGMFKQQWFRYYTIMPKVFDKIVMSWDCAFKDTKSSDYVVGTVWGKLGADSYLVGMARGKWDFVETVKQIRDTCTAFPYCQEKYIEEKANGAAVISLLRKQIPGLVPIIPVESKESRAYAVSFLFEAGNILFPANCNWVTTIENELKFFPNGKHDDIVDSISQALNRLYLRSLGRMVHMNHAGY